MRWLSLVKRYYETIRQLKLSQVCFRVFYLIFRPTFKKTVGAVTVLNKKIFFPKKISHPFKDGRVEFINRSRDLSTENVWQNKTLGHLWLYNLHYFDALNSTSQYQQQQSIKLLSRWVDENSPGVGVGWEPYPTSLRIVNMIKYQLAGGRLSSKAITSLYLQARYLYHRCEYHIMANHLFENFKALMFAGIFFQTSESKKWLKKGWRGFQKQLKEQILGDGGHFELSPMYHCLILEGLLDIECLIQGSQQHLQVSWRGTVNRMLAWLLAMTHPSRTLGYFNDTANGMVASLESIFEYAQQLGYLVPQQHFGLTALPVSGYFSYLTKKIKLLIDAANIRPNYQPGHAHADVLSFELSVNGYLVFVNLGTSGYAENPRRPYERSTQAHNTVVIDGKNSSDVWSNFRVGRRSHVRDIIYKASANKLVIKAVHDGYKSIFGGCYHHRRWIVEGNRLAIIDQFDGHFDTAEVMYHLHPSCQYLYLAENEYEIKLPDRSSVSLIFDQDVTIIKTAYALSFGCLQNTHSFCLKLKKGVRSTKTIIRW